MPILRRLAAGLLLIFLAAPVAAATEEERMRGWFLAAWTSAQIGEDQSAREKELRGYVLYPYLVAARLRYRLQRSPGPATDAAIERFLEAHGEEPVSRSLRLAWLRSLGERSQWERYLQHAPPDSSDPRLRCDLLAARLALGRLDSLREAALEQWMTGQDLPSACDPVWNWLDAQGLLTAARVEQRVQLALLAGRTGLARALARRLPPERAAPLVQAAALLGSPATELPRQLQSGLPPDNRFVLQAFWALARRDSQAAARLLEPLLQQRQFSEAERIQLRRSVALGLAYDHDPEAIAALEAIPPDAFDAAGHEWRVRTALWFGNWPMALQWIDAMPEAARQEPRWRYWRARALELTGQLELARETYAAIAHEREFYGFLAADRIGGLKTVRSDPLPDLPEVRQTLLGVSGILRARELFHNGLVDEASLEWRMALQDADTAVQAQAAKMASDWGWHHQAIVHISNLGLWDDVPLRYPLPYDKEVEAAARETDIPPAWLYAVLRQESLYHPRAVSSADAIGLMQILPSTARQVARARGRAAPSRGDLFDPAVNVRLGAYYLQDMLKRHNQRWILTLAAYNAGPARVPRWLPPEPMAADVWIENIPFNETRAYVQRILAHQVIFSWRLHGKPAPLLPLLDDVVPASLEKGA